MMPTETVKDSWTSYQAEVVPAAAAPVQIQESRRAFYAGAWTPAEGQ